jgi:hypothetical protein
MSCGIRFVVSGQENIPGSAKKFMPQAIVRNGNCVQLCHLKTTASLAAFVHHQRDPATI